MASDVTDAVKKRNGNRDTLQLDELNVDIL